VTHILAPLRRLSEPTVPRPGESWWVIEPPSLRPSFLVYDLVARWRGEFAGLPLRRRLGCLSLRVLQHMAYRAGYGGERFEAGELPGPAADFSSMEANLADIPEGDRQGWMLDFLGALNAGRAEAELLLPKSVVFELAGTCNFSCVDCGVGSVAADGSRFMEVASLRRWMAELEPSLEHIRINGLGEATLHPDFGRCMDLLDASEASKELVTNFSAPDTTYERLLDSHYVLLVSWDAAQKNLFEKLRRGADFEELRMRLPRVVRAAAKAGAPSPILLFTLRPTNAAELPGVVRLAADAGVERIVVNVLKLADNSDWTRSCTEAITASFEAASETAASLGVDLRLPDHLGAMPVRSGTDQIQPISGPVQSMGAGADSACQAT
jgi:hypothetical protein